MDDNNYEGIRKNDFPDYLENLRHRFEKGQMSEKECKYEFGILTDYLEKEFVPYVSEDEIGLTQELLGTLVDLSENFNDQYTITFGAQATKNYVLSVVIDKCSGWIQRGFPLQFITQIQNHCFDLMEKLNDRGFMILFIELSDNFLFQVSDTQYIRDYIELVHTKVSSYIIRDRDFKRSERMIKAIYDMYLQDYHHPYVNFLNQCDKDSSDPINHYRYSMIKLFIKRMYALYKEEPEMKGLFNKIRAEKVIDLDHDV
ncbi:MAG TPA: hypothetical protein VHA74_01935 [Candidatus Dojkabacteria bacterium]|nr:hypothetical protein [Candidatus Dojkabacteria bacterium]